MLFFSFRVESQITDNINWKSFSLVNINPKLNYNILLGINKKNIIGQLGKPQRIIHLYWKTLTEDVDEYIYGENIFYIDVAKSNLWGFVIKNSTFSLKYKDRDYSIGMSIENLKLSFPNSCKHKKENYITVNLLTDKGELSEGYLYFKYNSNNRITEIGFTADVD